jgi:hypothetical protein
MSNKFSPNVTDKAVNPVPFAMGAASASTTSTAIDLETVGTGSFRDGNIEFELSIPALATGVIPDASVVSLILETSTASNFATITGTYTETVTGAGGVGIAATAARFRIPSDCPRYVRFKTTRGAGGTTAAAVNATGNVRF